MTDDPQPATVQDDTSRGPGTARAAALILVITVPTLFAFLGAWPFFDPDEGRYAQMPHEMVLNGDWITPTLNYVPYFEKPPLFYWMTASSYSIFGFQEWAARLVTTLCIVASLWTAFALGRRIFGATAGLWSTFILGTILATPAFGGLLMIDVPLAALMFAALALWWFGHTEAGGRRWLWDAGFWIAIGLGVLTKGPVAAVLVLGSIGLYVLLCKQWRSLFRASSMLTAPLAVLVAAPWFVLVAMENPGFNHHFWYMQHIGRYLGLEGSREHAKSFFYFFWLLPIMLVPWSAFIPGIIAGGWRELWPPRSEQRRGVIYLLGGAVLITLFFSISVSKLPQYVLPVIPLVAVALGAWFDRTAGQSELQWGRSFWRSPLRTGSTLIVAFYVLLSVAALVGGPAALEEVEAMGPGRAFYVSGLLLALGVAVGLAARARDLRRLAAVIGGSTVILVVGLRLLVPGIAPNHQCKPLVDYITPGLEAGAELISTDSYLPTVGFYSGRRLFMNGPAGEITYGSQQISKDEHRQWFSEGVDDIRQRFGVATPVYMLVRDHEHAERLLPELGAGVQEIIWNKRRSVVGNAAAAALTPPLPGGLLGEARRRLAQGD